MKASDIKAGTMLTPRPIWNRTSRDKLPAKCMVIEAREGHCQTGVMVLIKSKSGKCLELDSGWFVEVGKEKTEEVQQEIFDK